MDVAEIAVVDAILEYFVSSFVAENAMRIGAEFERIAVDRGTGARVPYSGARGIARLLRSWASAGATIAHEDAGQILALDGQLGTIALEEGSQVELATRPVADLHQLCAQYEDFESTLMHAEAEFGYRWLAVGVDPTSTVNDLAPIPKAKSRIILEHLRGQGELACAMPVLTASVQVSLDYSSERDVVDKLKVGLALSPYVTAMFVNSPFYMGQETQYLSFRTHIWRHTDPERCGLFEHLMANERWSMADYAIALARLPLIYGYDARGELVRASGRTLVELMRDAGRRPTARDVWASSRQFWTEIRLKSVLEFRGMDCPPPWLAAAAPALWVGLLYDPESRERAWSRVRTLDVAERTRLLRDVAERGILAEAHGEPIAGTCLELAALAVEGLRRRGRMDDQGRDESRLLHPLVTMLERRTTPAETLLERWRRTRSTNSNDLNAICSHRHP